MTWAIQPTNTERPAQGPDIAPPTNWQGFGAAVQNYFRETDLFMGATQKTRYAELELAKSAGDRIGIDALNEWYTANDAGYDHLRPPPATVEDFLSMHGQRGSEMALEIAREKAAQNPEAWADIDLSEEGVDAQVNAKLAAEQKVDAELLALSPNPIRNALLGGLVAGLADPVNLAAIPFGLSGGSLWRVMLNEAAIGAGVEAVQFGTRVDFAERTGTEAPDLLEAMTYGALGGAILGGAIEAVPRAIRAARFFSAMRRTPEIAGLDHVRAEGSIRAAETAIDAGENPLDAVADVLRNTPPPEYIPPPLVLTPEMRSVTAQTPDPTPLAPDPITTESLPPAAEPPVPDGFVRMYHGGATKADSDILPNTFTTNRALAEKYSGNGQMFYVDVPKDADELEAAAINGFRTSLTRTLDPNKFGGLKQAQPVAPTTPGETAAMAETALNEAEALRKGAVWTKDGKREMKAPLLNSLRKSGVRIDPDSPEGQDLKAMGITARTMPGLFSRKKGGQGLDNLVADEWEERFPGIREGTGTPWGKDATYLDKQGVLDIIRRETAGDFAWMRAMDDAARLERDADALQNYDPQEAFLSKQPSETGFFVAEDPLGAGIIWDTNVERAFDDYLATNWPTVKFQPREIAEMKLALSLSGGEAEDLVMSVLSREQDFTELPPTEALKYEERWGTEGWEEAFFGRAVAEDAGIAGQGDGLTVGPVADAEAAGGGGPGAGRDYGVETTPAGQQAVIPGSRVDDSAARRAARLKAEAEVKALQSKQRRLNQVRVEDEVDGLFAQKQADIFDDLMSPQAQRFMEENLQAMRWIADEADVPVAAVADDGRQLNSLSDILGEIDDTDTLAREFDLCRFGGGEE